MRFFTMQQDITLPDVIQFREFDICGPRHIFYKEDEADLNDSTVMYLKEGGETIPDFIQSPIALVSDKVKKVLDMYEDDMVFKIVVFANKEEETMVLYHQLLLERMDMLSDQTEFYSNGSIKRLALDEKKIGEHKAFMLEDKRFPHPFISLEVAESLLRRHVVGIILKEVEVI